MKDESEKIINILRKAGLPVTLGESAAGCISPEAVMENLAFDKKIKEGRMRFILPLKIGEVSIHYVDDIELIRNSIQDIS